MEQAKHTPGPWQLNTGKRQTITDAEGGEIATIAQGIDANPADAALIAAAPELLEALQKLLRAVDRMPSNPADGIADECRAAIAKAKGEQA